MDEIEGYDEDLSEALEDLQAFIIRIQKLPEDKRAFVRFSGISTFGASLMVLREYDPLMTVLRVEKLQEAKKMEGKLKAANDLYKAFEAELRELPKSDAAKFLKVR
jgi:hypothetical protein